MDDFHVTVGERYRRHLAPHDYVWPRSCDGISVALITASGPASMPVATFLKTFDPAPRRKSGRRRS
jgi:hypothetical protein